MEIVVWLSLLLKLLLGAFLVFIVGFVSLPLLLAAITQWRNPNHAGILSSLYMGRVWHARLRPKHHGFHYPLFVFALDLEEVDDLFSDTLWPLSLIVNFRNMDHLKNGEGLSTTTQKGDKHTKQPPQRPEKCEIANRVLRLVAEKTKNAIQPTLETHRVICVTHLCYYGYCFNPVSFYYLQKKSNNSTTSNNNSNNNNNLEVVVAEVSNTPWNEMHCYVLHPNSIDEVQVKPMPETSAINYIWPKRFHVSPFMEMNYMYDWTFTNFHLQPSSLSSSSSSSSSQEADPLIVRATMKRGPNNNETHFTANFKVFRQGIHPYTIAWQLIYFPIYCFIIQIWIHYEAFWLFVKGIAFIPHPDDTETAVSAAIGAIMTPLFAFKDWVRGLRRSGGNNTTTPSSTTTGNLTEKSKTN